MLPKVRPNNYGFRWNICEGHDTAIFTMLYMILLTLWFHKIFKLIFLKQSSWPKPMYAEHWRKLAWATSLGNFLSYTFSTTILRGTYKQMLT